MSMRKFYDVSMAINQDMIVFPGDPKVKIDEMVSISKGDVCNVSMLCFGSHTGTHIDAPKHFCDEGMTIDQVSLEYYIGEAKVFQIESKKSIEVEDLEKLDIQPGDRILFKTSNSELLKKKEFDKSFVYISGNAAEWLVQKGIRTVGIDYLSVEGYGLNDFSTHYALLKNNIAVIEGLQLSEVEPGSYQMFAAPLKISNGNGSPARVVLEK